MRRTAVALISAALAGASCAPRGYVVDPSHWVDAAPWPQAERVRVEMTGDAFAPQVLTLQEDKAYVLEIRNADGRPHAFAAADFFRAVALREARVLGGASFQGPRFAALEIQPGQAVELSFVAVRPDDYPVACTLPGHEGRAMTGALRILPKPRAP